MLAAVLRQVRPDIEVVDYNFGALIQDEASELAAMEVLSGCDTVLSLYMPAEHGRLANDAVRTQMRELIVLPGFSFGGFHPDMIYVDTSEGKLGGFTHHYHSRIALAGFLLGRPADDTVGLYNALVMGRAGYFDAYAQERDLACQEFARFGIDINPLFDAWAGQGCFMHSINHPKPWCYAPVVLEQLRVAGLAGAAARVDPTLIDDDMRCHPTHPVLAPLARRLGIPAETGFKPFHMIEDHSISLQHFIALEYEAFAPVPREELERAAGVATLCGLLA